MSGIRGRNTRPELKLRKLLRGSGFSYQPKIFGKPDFIHRGRKLVVFVDGCFWHGCPKHFSVPASNKTFWRNKIGQNKLRDRKVNAELKRRGYAILRIWEHQLTLNAEACAEKIKVITSRQVLSDQISR